MFFSVHRPRTLWQSFLTTMTLVHVATVKELRLGHRNPILGLAIPIFQTFIMVLIMWIFYQFMGVRHSPIRGSFVLYMFSGIFLFLTYNRGIAAVAGAPGPTSSMMLHAPMNTAIGILSKVISGIYELIIGMAVMLLMIHIFYERLHFEDFLAYFSMFLLSFLTGGAIGLVFYGMIPWAPVPLGLVKTIYMRLNMIASGKMLVVNMLPEKMQDLFNWNPLFHIIDQARGFAFVNYNPYFTTLSYPIWVATVCLVIGMMLEFFTRQYASASWGAGK